MPVLSEAEGKNLVFGKQVSAMQRMRFPSAWPFDCAQDKLRTGFASVESILNAVKGSGSE
jgi:hypothetical protein